MRRAIELGKNALGAAAPNPMVGAVLVHDNRIIGEGYTSPYGGAHAEVNAVKAVKDKSLLKKATLYVTLEPCSHFGKTPPCSDMIIDNEIPEVVIGLVDPHDKVAGKGIEKLKNAGIQVTVGILEEACREHHKRFLMFQEQKRPYIILKWAESKDGFVAPPAAKRSDNPEPFWISNTYSKQMVHQWRIQEQAILVGTQTVLDDNPRLTARNWQGNQPVRIVLDRALKIPSHFHVFDGSAKTIVLTETIPSNGIEHITYESLDFEKELAHQICSVLFKHQIVSVIIEGGAKTLETFISSALWDEARIFKGQATFTSGIAAPQISGRLTFEKSIKNDTLIFLKND